MTLAIIGAALFIGYLVVGWDISTRDPGEASLMFDAALICFAVAIISSIFETLLELAGTDEKIENLEKLVDALRQRTTEPASSSPP